MDERFDSPKRAIDRTVRPINRLYRKDRSGGRKPDEQLEIARRVAIYTEQVERTGKFEWLPHREFFKADLR